VAAALPRSPFLYAIVDASLLAGRRVGDVVAALIEGGAGVLQLRAKEETDARFLDLAYESLDAARQAAIPLLVNDRPDIARIVGADGVHVGQEDLPPVLVRELLPRGALVGVSTHDQAQFYAACREPVDYVAVGPVFPTRAKDRADPVVGLDFVRWARGATALPIVAIGGIGSRNAGAVVGAGADGVAAISAVLSEGDIAPACARLLAALSRRP
jgi:thiamine-phosphate pyrophosphorylase